MSKIFVSFYATLPAAAVKYVGKKKVRGYSEDFSELLDWIESGNSLYFKKYKTWICHGQVRTLINALNRAGGKNEK